MEVIRYLGVAFDNHTALVALLQHHGATVWAPWSLLRPVFEASFYALWILDPSDGRERRIRGLRCEVRDALEQRRHLDSFAGIPEVREQIAQAQAARAEGPFKTYRAEAQALGLSWDRVIQKVEVVAALRKLSVVERGDLGPFMEATWRMLSGYEHGLGYASGRGSDMRRVSEVAGGATFELTIKDDEFAMASKSAYLLLLTGCQTFESRCTSAS